MQPNIWELIGRRTVAAIGVISMVAIFTGCVSLKQNQRDEHEAYVEGLQKARKLAYYAKCPDAVSLISGRIDVEEKKH